MSFGHDDTTALMGYAEPVDDAQRSFRAALEALARPGTIQHVALPSEYPPGHAVAAIALTMALADNETPVWLAETDGAIADYLRFHAGCPITADPQTAVFALGGPADMPELAAFAPGDDETPERSTTVIWSLSSLTGDVARRLSGPGIRDTRALTAAGLPDDFDTRWAANQERFPAGIDLFLAADDAVLGLPRTVTIQAEALCT